MFDEEDSINRYDDFITVRFLLASKMRPLLLLLLSDREYDLNTLREELNKPSASILHGLKELERINLIKKNFKRYSLSSKGVLYSASLKKLFMDLHIFEINRDFWLEHSIDSIPRDSFKNTYLLKDSVFVESDEHNLSKSFTKYLELLSNCGDMEIILPIFLEEHLEIILENLENGDNLLLITNDEVLSSLRNSKYYGDLADLSKKGKVIIRKVDYDLKIFLTICEDFMSLSLFFRDGLFDNSCFILNEHSDGIKWAKILFEKFFEKSVRVL
ncbi:MAG: DUF1724 domain-containing protein [Methanobrevibacter olleyae]|uniref:DUF1724 domain-containing protein n=1 Tax=Methanobrevibacter olleyae TaxID=294671 RepID=A0A8T3VSB7_METOL|nr:DUF1724 domain-containing protein [Methanobrevibacter olleyae]